MSDHYTFKHEAMKTTYAIRLLSEDAAIAKSVAHECFRHIDELESKLSRYAHGSDIWQINHMRTGDQLFISEESYRCLRQALEAYQTTGGLFDITLGAQIEHRKQDSRDEIPPSTGQLMIDPDRPAVNCIEAGREIDLGGIGKGFTLDFLLEQIRDWDGIHGGLLSAGASTQLAFGEQAWEINLSGDQATHPLHLCNQALSASGTAIQGEHIISPRTELTKTEHPRIWLTHQSAALADAYSTAALLMTRDELPALTSKGSSIYIEDPSTEQIIELT